MKQGLKRIEATLNQLVVPPSTPPSTTVMTSRVTMGSAQVATPATSKRVTPTYSFNVLPQAKATVAQVAPKTATESKAPTLEPQAILEPQAFVQPFPVQPDLNRTPALPRLKSPSLTSHRNGANPALATNLLQEIQGIVVGWQTELQQILRQIQELYAEGPIVDGWLESQPRQTDVESTNFRNEDIDRLLDYVEQVCQAADGSPVTLQTPQGNANYRLCGLNPDGQLWSRPCPPEQIPSVSLAIARYQRLRQLLGRKQYIETRLSQLAETLVVLHSHLKD